MNYIKQNWKGLAGIVAIIAAFFMALTEDAPVMVNVLGWIILGAAILGWLHLWRTQDKRD